MRAIAIFTFFGVSSFLPELSAQEKLSFEKSIQPLFRVRCAECHDERKQKSGYRLDIRSSALRGGDSGKPAIVPKKSAQSDLLRRVRSGDEAERMPPKGNPLSAEEIKLLTAWIDAGADWPDAFAGKEDARLRHWAFQAPFARRCRKSKTKDGYAIRSIDSSLPNWRKKD